MANQLVQYGAVVAGAVAIPAAVKGISAAYTAGQYIPEVIDVQNGVRTIMTPGQMGGAQAAADAGSAAFSKSVTDMVTSTSFLTTVGLGLAGILLGSGSKRPSLNLPNLAATAAVGISVSNLLAKGKAAATASVGATGSVITTPIEFAIAPPEDVGAITASSRGCSRTAKYQFPLNSSEKYWIRFKIKDYTRDDSAVKSDAKTTSPVFNTWIRLPLPNNIMDVVKLLYTDVGLGMYGGEGAKVVGDLLDKFDSMKGSGASTASQIGALSKEAVTSFKRLADDPAIAYSIGRRALQGTGFGNAADVITGSVPNPHMAVTFSGVNLKKHTFTWRFSPSSINESMELQNIIKELQRAALPGYEGDNKLLFKFPDVVYIEMSPYNLMTFQPCAIDSVAVNYAPNGVPSFFKNPNGSTFEDALERYPTEVELSLNFRELDVHTKSLPFYNDFVNVAESSSDASADPAPQTPQPAAGR